MRRYKTALQIAIVVVPVFGWFFYWLLEPFFRMTGEQWGYLVFLCLMMVVWIAGSRAAYGPSPPMYFVTVAIAFATGYMASGAPSPVFAIFLFAGIFTVGYLVARGERKGKHEQGL